MTDRREALELTELFSGFMVYGMMYMSIIKLLLALDFTNAVVWITLVGPANVGVLSTVLAQMVFSGELGTLQGSSRNDVL